MAAQASLTVQTRTVWYTWLVWAVLYRALPLLAACGILSGGRAYSIGERYLLRCLWMRVGDGAWERFRL